MKVLIIILIKRLRDTFPHKFNDNLHKNNYDKKVRLKSLHDRDHAR